MNLNVDKVYVPVFVTNQRIVCNLMFPSLKPVVPFTEENDIKVEAWKAQERQRSAEALFSKARDLRFAN